MTLRVAGSASKGSGPVETCSEMQRLAERKEAASDAPPRLSLAGGVPWRRPDCTAFALTLSLSKIREYFAPV